MLLLYNSYIYDSMLQYHGKGWPPKNGGYVKSHKWHTWNICIKVVKGLYEPYQSLSSAFMNNRVLESIAKHKTGKLHKGANCLPYCGKLSREKTFTNFAVLCLFMEIFLWNLGVRCSLVRHKWAIRERFLHKIVFFTNSRKFSQKFPAFGIFWLSSSYLPW